MKIELNITDETIYDISRLAKIRKTYDLDIYHGNIIITAHTRFNKTLESVFNSSSKIKDTFMEDYPYLKKLVDNMSLEDISVRYFLRSYENILNNPSYLWDYVDYVHLYLFSSDPLKYIEDNPILLKKKIVLKDKISYGDIDKVKEIKNKYSKYLNNIYLNVEGNSEYLTVDDTISTLNKVEALASDIRKLNLSPLENMVYVYDLVKSRIYNKEKDSDYEYISRDLSCVLNGDSIVCSGYIALYKAVLSRLGIEVFSEYLTHEDKSGHERAVSRVVDPKYGVDGVYFFDPTFDSKTSEEDSYYIDNYRFFLKTFSEINEESRKSIPPFKSEMFRCFTSDFISRCKCVLKGEYNKEEDEEDILFTLNRLYFYAIFRSPYNMEEFRRIFLDKDEEVINRKISEAIEIVNLYNKRIDYKTMCRVINNVRKIEYYSDPEKYPYSVDRIVSAVIKSNHKILEEDFSLDEILGSVVRMDVVRAIRTEREYLVRSFINDEGISKEISSVRFTNVLRNIKRLY